MNREASIEAALWAFALALLVVGVLAGLGLGRAVWGEGVPR